MARPSPQTERLLTLVDVLAARPHDGLTLSEIARRLGVNPATCHPMLSALTDAGWLVRHPSRKTFRLGPALVAAGQAAAAGFPALDFAHPAMVELQRRLGLACLALAPAEHHATLVDIVRDPHVPGPAIRVGDQTPFRPPLGIAYMAWAADDVVEGWLSVDALTDDARDRYRRALAATRQRGFAVDLVTPPEARVHEALTRLGDPATGLRALLEELAGELATQEEFLLVDVHRSRRYAVGSMGAPVFDAHGNVTLLLALRGFGDATAGRDVLSIGEHLLAATRSITAAIGGQSR